MDNKKIIRATGSKKHEADVARYMHEVRAMQAAGITRRDLFKMGLTTGVGGLIAMGGASFMPNLARADGSALMVSPANTPWMDPLPIPKTCVPTDTTMGGDQGQPKKDPSAATFTKENATNNGQSYAGFTDARPRAVLPPH